MGVQKSKKRKIRKVCTTLKYKIHFLKKRAS